MKSSDVKVLRKVYLVEGGAPHAFIVVGARGPQTLVRPALDAKNPMADRLVATSSLYAGTDANWRMLTNA